MKARFRGLTFVAHLSKIIGLLALITGLVLGAQAVGGALYFPLISSFAEPYSPASYVSAAAYFTPFLLVFLLFYMIGGILQVLVAIERNTRPEVGEAKYQSIEDAPRPGRGDITETP